MYMCVCVCIIQMYVSERVTVYMRVCEREEGEEEWGRE